MLEQHRRIKNGSEVRREIVDHELPGGRITLEPGEERQIPITVYQRNVRRHAAWLRNLDSPTYQPPKLKPEAKRKPKPKAG